MLSSRAVQAVIALVVLAAILRFYRIGHQGFWFDEANASNDMRYSLGTMLGLLPRNQTTPPLYYLIGWVWARIFGFSEVPLRSLSALVGVAVVPVIYAAGARLIAVRVGLVAAALAACNPLLIWYSQEARPYMLLVLLSAASLLAFSYAREQRSHRSIAIWAVVSMLAVADHYYALLVVVPEALWLLAIGWRRRDVQMAVAVVGIVGLGLLPLAIAQNHTGNANWIAKWPLGRRTLQIFPQFAAGFPSPAYSVLEPLALALAILGLLLVGRSNGVARRAGQIAGSLVVIGLLLNFMLVAAGIDDLLTRNVLALWPLATLAVATGFAAGRPHAVGLAAATALCAIGVGATIGLATNRAYQRPDWRGVARMLGASPASPRVILVQHYGHLLPLSLYLPGLRFMSHRSATVSALDVVSFTSPPSAGFCWWGSACNLWPSRMQAGYAIPGFRPVWRRRVYQFTVLHMVAIHGRAGISSATVSPALQTTRLRNDELLIQR